MENGCSTFISKSNWWNVVTRLLCFDSGDDPVQLSPNVENNDDLATETVSNEVVSVRPSPELVPLSIHADVGMPLEKLLWGQDEQTGQTILHEAVEATDGRGQSKELVEFMIDNGLTDAAVLEKLSTSEIVQRPKNTTLAHLAIKFKDIGALQLVAEHLPELVKATDDKGWMPLSYAANKGFLDGVNYLLANFPETAEEYDEDGYLPIHKAVGRGHVSIVEAFYKHCPQTLHCVDKKGRSVLHISVIYYRLDVFSYLTKEVRLNDSFLNLRDNKGKTFIDYAKDYHTNIKC